MRVALVVHGFPPRERTGVEVHTEALAGALARAGLEVHVLAPFATRELAPLAQRREARDGYHVTWIGLEGGRASDPLAGPRGIDAGLRAFFVREQIELVHFQHVAKLGARAIAIARELGLPVVYTAHDYTPLGPNPTLCLPDLTQQTDLSAAGYARWRSARTFLDTLAELGDHHGHVLAEELTGEQRRELAARIAASSGADDRDASDWEEWRALFRSCDRLFATSRFLAARLARELGVAVEPRAAGIEPRALERVLPVDPSRERLRFGFLGALLRPKGVHLLLEAFEPLRGRAELVIHGDSHDEHYVRGLAARAREAGARMAGGYSTSGLAARLAGIEVLVVPSLWTENAPFVVREAFAARRPVLAARTEALAESVRDGVDGCLVEQGSASALREGMRRLIEDRGLLARLIEGIAPVREIDDEAREYAATYRELVEAARARRAPDRELPASLVPFAARYRALRALPTHELCARAIAGMRSLLPILGITVDAGSLLPGSLTRGARSRDALDAAAREIEWLEEVVTQAGEARASETRRADWLTREVRARDEHVATLSAEKRAAGEAWGALSRERDWLAGVLSAREQESAWRERSARQSEAVLERARAALEVLERARAELQSELARAEAELAIERGEHASSRDALRAHAEEARWRAAEMESARRAATTKLRARLLGGELVRRARAWPAPPGTPSPPVPPAGGSGERPPA